MHNTKDKGKTVMEDPVIGPVIGTSNEMGAGDEGESHVFQHTATKTMKTTEGGDDVSAKSEEEEDDEEEEEEDEDKDEEEKGPVAEMPPASILHEAPQKSDGGPEKAPEDCGFPKKDKVEEDCAFQHMVASGSGESLQTDTIEDEKEAGDDSPLAGILRKARLKRKGGPEKAPEVIARAACGSPEKACGSPKKDKFESSRGAEKRTRSKACKKLC